MLRLRYIVWFAVVIALIFVALTGTTTAQANVTRLILTRRTCGTVNAFLTYDGFSEGTPAFYNVVAVDLNGNGVYGEAGEPVQYIKISPGGQTVLVGAQLRFPALPEGSTISVTALGWLGPYWVYCRGTNSADRPLEFSSSRFASSNQFESRREFAS